MLKKKMWILMLVVAVFGLLGFGRINKVYAYVKDDVIDCSKVGCSWSDKDVWICRTIPCSLDSQNGWEKYDLASGRCLAKVAIGCKSSGEQCRNLGFNCGDDYHLNIPKDECNQQGGCYEKNSCNLIVASDTLDFCFFKEAVTTPKECGWIGRTCCKVDKKDTCPNSGFPSTKGASCTCQTIGSGSNNPFCAIDKIPESGVKTAFGCIPIGMNTFIPWVMTWLFGIAGGIAFLLMIYGFILIATSSGDEKKIQAAKETITSAIIGLLVCIFSVFILRLITVNILQIPGIS